MECLIVLPPDVDLERQELVLRGEEAHHAARSLRLHAGDELLATNLIGMCYRCRMDYFASESLHCTIEELLPNYGESEQDILLIASLVSQPARWEFLLEKTTELGVRAIQPMRTERTERGHFRQERSEKILRAAVKQSKRARMPVIKSPRAEGGTQLSGLSSLREALGGAADEGRNILLLHEKASSSDSLAQVLMGRKGCLVALAVGPEGGFTDDEVRVAQEEFGSTIVSLGPRRLRAETAAIAALAILMA